jgi:hypothetical protein
MYRYLPLLSNPYGNLYKGVMLSYLSYLILISVVREVDRLDLRATNISVAAEQATELLHRQHLQRCAIQLPRRKLWLPLRNLFIMIL